MAPAPFVADVGTVMARVVPVLAPVAKSTLRSCTSPPEGADTVKVAAVGVPTVNPREYAAELPEVPPVFAVVTENEFTFITVTVPLKLSWFAFLTIIISPLLLPWFVWSMVNVVPDRVQVNPALIVELDTNQHSISELMYA